MIEKDLSFSPDNNTCIRVSEIAKAYFPDYQKTQSAMQMLRKRIRESKMLYENYWKPIITKRAYTLRPYRLNLYFTTGVRPKLIKLNTPKISMNVFFVRFFNFCITGFYIKSKLIAQFIIYYKQYI